MNEPDLPNGVRWDPTVRRLTVGRGVGNTLLLLAIGTLIVGGPLALGISNVGDTDTALGTKLLAGAFGTAVVGIFGIVLTVLWRARWSIDRDGIVLAMGRARRIPWSQVSALRLTGSAGGTSGSGARSYVHIELRGTERKSTHTPSRLREAPLRTVLRLAQEQELIPDHVRVDL